MPPVLVAMVLIALVSLLIARKRNKCELSINHCYITGGSSGLGLALAIEMAKMNAHVTIVARNTERLLHAVKTIQINYIAADVTDPKASAEAFKQAMLNCPCPVDCVIACAGEARPALFRDQHLEDFETGMKLNYLGALYTIWEALKAWTNSSSYSTCPSQQKQRKRLVLISSTVGLTGLVGYSQYSPTKFALRGLAETLRQELQTEKNISIHIYFVSTITSSGWEREQATKPRITKEIEGGDNDKSTSPESRAKTLIQGLVNDRFMITSDWNTYLLLLSSLGTAPRTIAESILAMLVSIVPVGAIWRSFCDARVAQALQR